MEDDTDLIKHLYLSLDLSLSLCGSLHYQIKVNFRTLGSEFKNSLYYEIANKNNVKDSVNVNVYSSRET
jgi:hypothetical protein